VHYIAHLGLFFFCIPEADRWYEELEKTHDGVKGRNERDSEYKL
jgi:hypothetical protein